LLAVAAPVPQFVVYEQCTIVDPARSWCNVLVANYVGDTYCCDTKIRFEEAVIIGQHCEALDRSPTQCNVILTGPQTAWCCDSLGQRNIDYDQVYNDAPSEDDRWLEDDGWLKDDGWQDIYYVGDDA